MNAVSPQKTRRKKAVGRVMLVCGGLLAGLLVAECVLRVMTFSEPQIYVPDQFVGTRLQTGFEGMWTKEGQAQFRINSAGFRDIERKHAKPAGTFRIAVLGDSYVEALQVPLENAFWSVLESELADCDFSGQKNVEVLGFGRLELDNTFRQHPSYIYANKASTRFKVACINRSRVLQLYSRVRNGTGRTRTDDDSDSSSRNNIENICYVQPETATWRDAWELTERLVVEIHKEVQQRAVPFVLVAGSNGIQVDPRESVREEFRKQLGVTDLFYFEQRIEALANRKGITAISLGKPMAQAAQRDNLFLHGFSNTAKGRGHWNADGHRLAAKLIAEKLCDGIQPRSAPGESLR